MTDRRSVNILGIPISKASLSEALDRVDDAVRGQRPLHIGVVNAAKLVNMRHDSSLRDAVLSSDEIYADGMSVVWAGRLLGAPLPERVTGIDLMTGILERGDAAKYRVYCLGATEDVSRRVASIVSRDYPGLELVGCRDGYFSQEDEAGIVREIKELGAQILLVGIASPKKELFMARWADELPIVTLGVGGSFDVLAGVVNRAPPVWQRLGFEWLYRLLQEPRRMWRRYLVTNTVFCCLLAQGLFVRLRVAVMGE